jgi:hypothetical protein
MCFDLTYAFAKANRRIFQKRETSGLGHGEKNSRRAYVFRITAIGSHCSTTSGATGQLQLAILKRPTSFSAACSTPVTPSNVPTVATLQ